MLRILAAMTMLALAPAPPAALPGATAAQPFSRTVQANIRFAGPGRRRPVPYEMVRGLLLVRGTVAGREAWILLDTGAGRTIVDTGLARRAGLRIEQAPISLVTPGGAMAGHRVEGPRLAIRDQLGVQFSWALATDLGPVSVAFGRPVEAVLGWDILGRIAVLVDPRGATLGFAPSGMVPTPAGASSVTLSDRGRIPVGIGGQRLSLFIDLGSNHAVGLREDLWDRLAPAGATTRPSTVTHAQGERRVGRLGVLPEVMLGDIAIRDVTTVIEGGRPDEGHVGMGLLARFVLLLDAGQGRLWFVPPHLAGPATEVRPAPPSSVGR